MQTKSRTQAGNAIISIAVLAFLGLCVAFIGFSYVRLLTGQQEQTSAIEGAALVAAKDLTRIIVKDPNYGYVALCDYPPEGAGIAAPDGFGLPVHSINTILATIRLDMIIADNLNNTIMKQAAITDFNNAMAARQTLADALNSAITDQDATFTDVNGTTFCLYSDVTNAYTQNAIRANGKSNLAPGSVQLTLGYEANVITNIPVPAPRAMDPQLSNSSMSQGCYLPNRTIAYSKYQFVFSGLPNSTNLINDSDFQVTLTNVQYSLPSAIRVEANQQYTGTGNSTYLVHIQACAQAGGNGYNDPAPGALVFSFPDGCPAEITTPESLVKQTAFLKVMAVWRSFVGDYPIGNATVSGANEPPCFKSNQNNVAYATDYGIYIWLKRAGPCMNIQDFLNMMNTLILPATIAPANSQTWPLMATYTFNPSTGLIQKQLSYMNTIYASNSDAQLFVSSYYSFGAASTGQIYDLVMSFDVYQPSGLHSGEPIVDTRLTQNSPYTADSTPPVIPPKTQNFWNQNYVMYGWSGPNGGWAFHVWKEGIAPSFSGFNWCFFGGDNTPLTFSSQPKAANVGDMRPTYSQNGLAVEIALHQDVNSIPQMPK